LTAARDFSDVRDIVRGYHLALTQGEPGAVYNMGSGRSYSAGQVLDILLRLSKLEIKVEQDASRLRPVEVPDMVANSSKLRACTGWGTEIPLERSLRDVLDYWREQVRIGAGDPTPLGLRIQRGT
jgi:GDP-4-dehydro-6-deoxy-D-mannose reductase